MDDLKAVAYVWLRRGRPGMPPAAARSIKGHVTNAMPLMRHLVQAGVERIEDIQPLFIWDFIHSYSRKVVPSHLSSSLELLDAAWVFREELRYPFTCHPFAGKALGVISGIDARLVNQTAALTPVIPPSINERLFDYALGVVSAAERLLAERDSGRLGASARKLLVLRDAVLYLTEIGTGMRNSEALNMKNRCWRSEVKNGITFHWIRTVDVKTKAGPVDYLMPPDLEPALALLERFARPLQQMLHDEISALKRVLTGGLTSDSEAAWLTEVGRAKALERLAEAEASCDSLFLSQAGRKRSITGECQIHLMNNSGSSDALARVAEAAGVTWPLTNMQCRRTFAWLAAHSFLGVHGTIFVRWQFRHKDLSLSQLYGANPLQDPKLYGELWKEFAAAKNEVLSSWFLEDEPLSGGARERIMRARATPAKDLKTLLQASAESITLRNTGHSWCMSENGACVGGGVYESYRCGTCSDGVIDARFTGTWQRIHIANLRLTQVGNCGPGAQQHVARALNASRKVLADLGVTEPTLDNHPKYQ
ncbi:MAG: hypothetical protein JSR75_19765 [Proteobacteria bacterium]|nr:hypothetical protein [Pseudomonadota bacterium]